MPTDRRLLGEDDFFEPRDLSFVTQPVAPAVQANASVVAPPAPVATAPTPTFAPPKGVIFEGSPEALAARYEHTTEQGTQFIDPYAGLSTSQNLAGAAPVLGFTGEALYDPGRASYQGSLENYSPAYELTPEYKQFLSERGYQFGTWSKPGVNGQYFGVFDPTGKLVPGTEQFQSNENRAWNIATGLLSAAAGNIAPLGFGVLNTASALQQGNIGAAALNLAKLAGVPGVGDITKTIGQTASKAVQDLLPDNLFGTTIGDAITKTAQDAAQQAAFSAITGKEVDLGSAITSSLINQGLGGIAKEIGISPKTLTSGLKIAAGKGGVSDIYNLVSGGLGKISDISKEGLAQTGDTIAGPSELSKSTLANDILSGTVAPDTDIRTLADTILGKGDEVTLSPLPLEFVQPSGPSVSLPDDFISSLAPEVAETFPVESRDVRSADQRIETIGRREEDLDVPLDIYLPELFGGQPRAGELQGPSTIETIGKRPTEPVTPIPSFLVEDILRDGVPDEKTPSQIADEILGEQQKIEVIGKRPGDSITPIPSFLDDVQIRQEPLPDTKTPAQLAEEILPPPPPVSPSAPRPAPAPAPAPTPAPTPAKPDDLDLSALFALLGMMGQRPEEAEAYQLANVAPGVEAGLRAIEQMYGIRRG